MNDVYSHAQLYQRWPTLALRQLNAPEQQYRSAAERSSNRHIDSVAV